MTSIEELLKRARRGEGIEFATIPVTVIDRLETADKLPSPSKEYHCIYIPTSSFSTDTLESKKGLFVQAIRQHIEQFHTCDSAYEIVHDIACGSALSKIGVLGIQVFREKPNIFCIYTVF